MSLADSGNVAVNEITEPSADERRDDGAVARLEKPVLSVVDHPFHHFNVKGDSRQYHIVFPPKILALATSANTGGGDDDDINRMVYCDQCSERLDNFEEKLGLTSSDQIPDDHNPLVRRVYLQSCADEGITPNNGVLHKFSPGLPCILSKTGMAFTHCFIGETGFRPVLSILTLMQNLQRVDLSNMGLRDSSILTLVPLVEKRQGLNIIDLSHNHYGNKSFDLLMGLLIKAPGIFRLYVDNSDLDNTRQLVLDLETYTHRCAYQAKYDKARRLAIAENPRWIRGSNDELFAEWMGHLVPTPFCKPLVAGKERDVVQDLRTKAVMSPRSPGSPGRSSPNRSSTLDAGAFTWDREDSVLVPEEEKKNVAAAIAGRLPSPELAPDASTGVVGVRWSGLQTRPPKNERDIYGDKLQPSMWCQFVARRWWEERRRILRGGGQSGKMRCQRTAAENALAEKSLKLWTDDPDGAAPEGPAAETEQDGADGEVEVVEPPEHEAEDSAQQE